MSPIGWSNQAVYLQSGDPERESNPTLAYPGQLGMRFTTRQPHRAAAGAEEGRSKTYQIVKTDSTMTVAPFKGAVAWWADKTQYLVTTTVTALGRGRIAGVFQNLPAYPITRGHYTCIQTGGPGITKFVDGAAITANSGQFVIPSATNGKADIIAAGTAATYPVLGVIAGTLDASAMECIVDLDVPQTT